MPSLSSRMSHSSDSTALSGTSSPTPSMDMDTQLAPLSATRKRSRNLNEDSDEEEPQARRARAGDSNSNENRKNLMATPRSRQSGIFNGRNTISRQEQEQIPSTFAKIGGPAQAQTESTLVSPLSRADQTIQPSTTHQAHGSTSQQRSYEENFDYDADISGDERPSNIRRRGTRQDSTRTPAVHNETRAPDTASPPASNEASVVENRGSRADLLPVSNLLLGIEGPSSQIASTRGGTIYIDLTLEDSSDEEHGHNLSPASSVLPVAEAPSIQDIQPNGDATFFDLTLEDSSDEEEGAATMSQAYIGDRIVLVEEERLEPFLPEPTAKFQRLLELARTQKLHCLDKWGAIELEDDVEFHRELAVLGTSGNVYMVCIKKKPDCNCPDGRKDMLCVHLVFILTQFLNLSAPLRHQSTFLEAELKCMMGDERCWMGPLSSDKFCIQKRRTPHVVQRPVWGECPSAVRLELAQANYEDEQPDITCVNCRAPWIWVGRQLVSYIEGMWNAQFGIAYNEAGYRTLSDLLRRNLSIDGYFNVANLLGIDKTVKDDAEVRQSQRLQRDFDRWRSEMARRPNLLREEVDAFIERYFPQVAENFRNNPNDGSPEATNVVETMRDVRINVRRSLQYGYQSLGLDSPRPYNYYETTILVS
ncbi:SWIM zinc finger protein [Botrytis cinerea]